MRRRRRAAASSGRSVFGANAFLKPMLSSLRFKQNGSHSYSAPARCAAPHKVAIPKRQRAIFHRIECRRKIVILSALHRQHRWPGVGRCSDCLDLYSRLASCHAAELREGFLARSNAKAIRRTCGWLDPLGCLRHLLLRLSPEPPLAFS